MFFQFYQSRRFDGFYALRKGHRTANNDNNNMEANLEAHQMANRLRTRVKIEEGMDVDGNELDEDERRMLEQEENNMRMVAASKFRDVPFDKWLHVFIKVSALLFHIGFVINF